ncbi:MAG: PucR family transcriptional regulator [Propionibacteriaceae bacterium]|nr:PucR family transcriptional regulator [Propionibacteriaceae bacterium]
MAFDLKWLLGQDELGLGLVYDGGEHGLNSTVTWVHQSELNDSTLFSEPGEVLITTGSNIPLEGNLENLCNSYVKRLRDSGVVGLGFGLGVHHDEVPPDLVAAAQRHRLPVFTIPYETPFSAVIKAVSHSRSAAEQSFLRQANSAQRRLIAAVGGKDPIPAILTRTAQTIDGWAALANPSGLGVREITHPGNTALALDLAQQHVAAGRGATFTRAAGAHLAAFSIASGTVRQGILLCGSRNEFDSVSNSICVLATTLLGSQLTVSARLDAAFAELRPLVMEDLLTGHGDPRLAASLWPSVPEEPLALLCATPASKRKEGGLPTLPAGTIQALVADQLIVVTEALRAEAVEKELAAQGYFAGSAAADTWAALKDARPLAEQAMLAARLNQADEPASLLSFLDPTQALSYAHGALGALTDPRHAELRHTLKTWLESSGSNEQTAALLDVHRHTVRRRLERIADLLNVDLSHPQTRNDLYFALRILG